jgi:hypothetical protein
MKTRTGRFSVGCAPSGSLWYVTVYLYENGGNGPLQEKFGDVLGEFLSKEEAKAYGEQLITHWKAGGNVTLIVKN